MTESPHRAARAGCGPQAAFFHGLAVPSVLAGAAAGAGAVAGVGVEGAGQLFGFAMELRCYALHTFLEVSIALCAQGLKVGGR
jgi:hypothetical protein